MSSTKSPRIRLNVENLEERVVPAWAGVPPTAIGLPAYTAVTLNAQRDAAGNASIANSEVDYYSFVAPTAGTYRFAATTPTSNLDPVLGVFNSSGQRVAYNDDANGSTDSNLTVNLNAGQRYYFGITNYTGSGNGTYTWLVDGPNPTTPAPTPTPTPTPTDDAYENNDSQAQAYNLGTLNNSQTINNLQMRDGQDWFRFTTTGAATSASQVAIAFTHSQGDLDLRVYNSAGQLVGRSEGTGNSEAVSLNGQAAGTYFVQVFGYNGAVNPNYSLSINPAVAAPTPTPTPTPAPGAFDVALSYNGLSSSQIAIFEQAAARWEAIIVGDLPNATWNGQAVDDVLISASVVTIDGRGGILGQAGPDSLRSGSFMPIHGVMQFDAADMAAMEANGTLLEVIVHEMGHVLGVGTLWTYHGLLTGAGTSNPLFVGARATAEYNALFGTNAGGVPVENTMGAGSRDSHWRESIFGNELMSPVIGGAGNPISRITAASLADMGYQVNMNAAGAYTPPTGTVGASSTQSSGGTGASARLTSGSGTGCSCMSCQFYGSLEIASQNASAPSHNDVANALVQLGQNLQERIVRNTAAPAPELRIQLTRLTEALQATNLVQDDDHDEPALAAHSHDADLDGSAFQSNLLHNILTAANLV